MSEKKCGSSNKNLNTVAIASFALFWFFAILHTFVPTSVLVIVLVFVFMALFGGTIVLGIIRER